MSRSPETTAMIQALEAKLSELDPILHGFCNEAGFTFTCLVGSWPRRKVWVREEIDRCLDLTMESTVSEIMDRGFYPEMPWSLRATASLMQVNKHARVLSIDVFRGLPFSELAGVLALRLEDGQKLLRGLTREDVVARGQIHGSSTESKLAH